jgi:hypothetical protein
MYNVLTLLALPSAPSHVSTAPTCDVLPESASSKPSLRQQTNPSSSNPPQPAESLPNNNAPTTTEINFTPGAYVTRLGGDIKLGPGRQLNIINDLSLNEIEAAFNAELSVIKNDTWQMDFVGTAFSTEQSHVIDRPATFGSLQLDPGDPFHSTFDLNSVSAQVVYWFYQPCRIGPLPGEGGRLCRVNLRIGASIGFEYVDIDHTLDVVGKGREDTGGEWVSPFVGINFLLRYNLPTSVPLLQQLELGATATFGPALGGDGGFISTIRGGFNFMFSDNVGLTIGYRLIQVDVENDDFEFSGGLQGLFLGATVRF